MVGIQKRSFEEDWGYDIYVILSRNEYRRRIYVDDDWDWIIVGWTEWIISCVTHDLSRRYVFVYVVEPIRWDHSYMERGT